MIQFNCNVTIGVLFTPQFYFVVDYGNDQSIRYTFIKGVTSSLTIVPVIHCREGTYNISAYITNSLVYASQLVTDNDGIILI